MGSCCFLRSCASCYLPSCEQLPSEQLPNANWLFCTSLSNFFSQVLALRRHELRGMRSQGNGKDVPSQRGILLSGNQRTATKWTRWPFHADLHGLQEQGCLR